MFAAIVCRSRRVGFPSFKFRDASLVFAPQVGVAAFGQSEIVYGL